MTDEHITGAQFQNTEGCGVMHDISRIRARTRTPRLKGYLNIVTGLAFGLTLLLLLVGQAQASEENSGTSLKKEVDGYKVELVFTEGKAQTGDNKLKIELHDAQDQPVDKAKVTVTAEMNITAAKGTESSAKKNTHGASTQSPERVKAVELKAGHETGEYVGQVKFHDAGKWNIKVTFVVQQQPKSATFEADVMKADASKWYVLWGFLGVNLAVIITAAATRKKTR